MCYPFILKWSFSLKEDHPYGLRLDVIELPHILSIPNIGDVFVPRCVPLEEMQSFIFQTDVKSSNEFGIMVCVRYMNLLTFFERYPVSFKSVDSRLIILAEVGNKVWLKTKGKRNWKKRQKFLTTVIVFVHGPSLSLFLRVPLDTLSTASKTVC